MDVKGVSAKVTLTYVVDYSEWLMDNSDFQTMSEQEVRDMLEKDAQKMLAGVDPKVKVEFLKVHTRTVRKTTSLKSQ